MDYLQYRKEGRLKKVKHSVLNLIINGLPSIHYVGWKNTDSPADVLNLIINGLPSIPKN